MVDDQGEAAGRESIKERRNGNTRRLPREGFPPEIQRTTFVQDSSPTTNNGLFRRATCHLVDLDWGFLFRQRTQGSLGSKEEKLLSWRISRASERK
jgi:hypothetical protein